MRWVRRVKDELVALPVALLTWGGVAWVIGDYRMCVWLAAVGSLLTVAWVMWANESE